VCEKDLPGLMQSLNKGTPGQFELEVNDSAESELDLTEWFRSASFVHRTVSPTWILIVGGEK